LDITITRGIEKFTIDIHRKSTYTDTIIPEDSCHPKEQKMAAIRYFYNRMNKYHLSLDNLEKENHTLQQIVYTNGYDISTAKNVLNKKNANMEKKDNNKKIHWLKFTYIGKETRAVTKAFRNTNVNITFSTNNTINNLLRARLHTTKDKYDNSGIYQLTCPTCRKKYIGQTDSSFTTRFREHFRDIKHENRKFSFAHHLLDNGHSIGPIEDIMETIHVINKGKMMDILENVHIFRETKLSNQINDKLTVKPNIIFDVIIRNDPHTNSS